MMTIENLVLRPNCLLTRSPLIFLSGPRSLFATRPMGEELQQFMMAHGYPLAYLWLPFRSTVQRQKALGQWLQKNQAKSFHFFMAEETWRELQPILEQHFHPYSTITIINLNPETPRSHLPNTKLHGFGVEKIKAPLSYQLHGLFCSLMNSRALPYEQTLLDKNRLVYDRFLDHCVELAENEYKDLTSRM